MFTPGITARFPNGINALEVAALVIKYETFLKQALPVIDGPLSGIARQIRETLHEATCNGFCDSTACAKSVPIPGLKIRVPKKGGEVMLTPTRDTAITYCECDGTDEVPARCTDHASEDCGGPPILEADLRRSGQYTALCAHCAATHNIRRSRGEKED